MAHPLSLDVETLLAQEPSLRALARHLLGEEADDLVQETWLRALTRGGFSIREPRRWLRRIARNVANNLGRTAVRRSQRERAAAVSEAVPSSLELLEREERRRALVLAVDDLSSPLRAVVLLRYFEGRPPRAIAADLGIPVTLVWDRLERARAQLRARLDQKHGGDRTAWLLPLALPAAPATTKAAGWTLWMGVLVMTAKVKTLAAAAAALLLAGIALWAAAGGPGVAWNPGPEAIPPAAGIQAEAVKDLSRPASQTAAQRESVAQAPVSSGPATLVVHATYAQDGSAAAGVTLVAGHVGEDQWIGPRRETTDARGFARFEGLLPGRVRVWTGFGAGTKSVTLVAGQIAELEFSWPAGLDVGGIVVDSRGAPVASAEVWFAALAHTEWEATCAATTGDDGRFALRSAHGACYVGARAAGHAPSAMQVVLQERGQREVRIVLAGAGGDVEGIVVHSAGPVVADALVCIGHGKLLGITGGEGVEALPALVRTGRDGRFRAVGLAAGEHPVVVRAARLQPWTGTCRVVAGVVASLHVTLQPGVTLVGTVTVEPGTVVEGAALTVGEPGALTAWRTGSKPDGTFRLDGLPAGDLVVAATHRKHGKATVRLRGAAGETLPCDVRLGPGLVLRGRLLFEDGEPVAGGFVNASAEAVAGEGRWQGSARADEEGRFAIDNCPDGRRLQLMAEGSAIETLTSHRVDPRAGELILRARRSPRWNARIVGTVLLPDGRPAADLRVSVSQGGSGTSGTTDANGRVEIGRVRPGTVRLRIDAEGAALFRRERALAAHETWDVGTVRLGTGGTVQVRLSGETAGTRLFLHDTAGTLVAGISPTTHRSRLLEPGRYVLHVDGPTTAATIVPVDVRDREETVLEVKSQAGLPQRFTFTAPGGWPDVGWFSVQITSAGRPLFHGTVRIDDEGRSTLECRLLPGAYSVTATAAGRAGRAEFNVAEGDSAAVRVELR